ncbi:hypothetical protein RJ639_024982 [Escallonia herrerae]|uniref:NB-ARC domain-containing protein n=1 Tax=Escallonia herrerae TaxID=1293975 RepID=A0AA88UY14_9ASTE|nr:hypothetical protein RJ639_024982 [Escallonia herrerae]
MDDVWDKEAWESLRRAFPTDARGSRIIITTRNKEIATRTAEGGFFHELRFLTQGESWDLFCQKAFPGDGEISCCPPAMTRLAEKGEKMGWLTTCYPCIGRDPIAQEGTRRVRDHIWLHLENDSVEIWELLTLSYNDLSPKLKPFFLYLGMFPEDCEIDTARLTRLWMAEDFIIQRRCWEKVVTCRVHDLLRDLAVKKAAEVNFFGVLDKRNISAPLVHSRRYAIQDKIDSYFLLGIFYSKTRTKLLSCSECFTSLPVNLWKLVVIGIGCIRSVDSLANLKSLDTLVLQSRYYPLPPLEPLSSCTRLLYLLLHGAIHVLPASSSFPESLASLILWCSDFTEDPMPMLDSLPNLRSLELINAFEGNRIVCSTNGFRQQEVIRISDLRELEEWQVEEGAMPVIKGWCIHECNKLKIIPERLKYVPTTSSALVKLYGIPKDPVRIEEGTGLVT